MTRKTAVLQLTEIKLPLDHGPEELTAAILRRLRIRPEQLRRTVIQRRGVDARKRPGPRSSGGSGGSGGGPISFIYTVHVEVDDEAPILAKLANRRELAHIK